MTASENVDAKPKVPAGGAAPHQQKDRKRPVTRWVLHGLLFAGLAVGLFGVLPRIGGLAHDTAELRHARRLLVGSGKA